MIRDDAHHILTVSIFLSFQDMFNGALQFNQDLNSWDTKKTKSMYCMFRECLNFDQKNASWDLTHVKDKRNMFFANLVYAKPKK